MHAEYEASISFGTKVITKGATDRQANRQTGQKQHAPIIQSGGTKTLLRSPYPTFWSIRQFSHFNQICIHWVNNTNMLSTFYHTRATQILFNDILCLSYQFSLKPYVVFKNVFLQCVPVIHDSCYEARVDLCIELHTVAHVLDEQGKRTSMNRKTHLIERCTNLEIYNFYLLSWSVYFTFNLETISVSFIVYSFIINHICLRFI